MNDHIHTGHDHSGHAHTHEDGCACNECRHETENKNPSISSHLQDGACIVSAQYHTCMDAEALGIRLTELLEELASKINAHGGIIGHIKASLDIHRAEMYSVTEEKVTRKSSQVPDITLCLAAIVFMVPEEELLAHIKTMFQKLA
ncbi:hypothetical protein [Murimonas intestini]|uniref:Uncharacterized protein n=1 Tax=Murimonas intestini TaxID=1337051 RepID=A0AB73T6P2_9FIRM|nr:hypothetical protein [Murimonas intestini]MCR1839507.1 hypothetical protein [Murimonas intestini]MCR1866351.1 hypothetical protein [Murimonas intestini]MCR1882532.1 hypothetical protein [Murimonas intestini]